MTKLETMSGAKIDVPKSTEASDKITIRGSREAVKKAIFEIKKISDALRYNTLET